MQLTEETINVLKYFSMINPSISIKPGNVLRTIQPQKTTMAQATVDVEFDSPAVIYDLSRFLATVSLFENPEIHFKENYAEIVSGNKKVRYTFADESLIVTPPEKDIKLPEPDAVVNVSWGDMKSVEKAAGVLKLPEIAFTRRNGEIQLEAINSKDPTADNYSTYLVAEPDENLPDFTMIMKAENLRLIPDNYEVSLSSKGMAHFKSDKVQYWVAIESHSTFGE